MGEIQFVQKYAWLPTKIDGAWRWGYSYWAVFQWYGDPSRIIHRGNFLFLEDAHEHRDLLRGGGCL